MRTGIAVLATLAAATHVAGAQQTTTRPAPASALERSIVAMIREPAVAGAHWGVVVQTLDGSPIVELDPAKLFQPASNAKLLTTATAMALLGPDATVTTRLTTHGTILADSTLTGDLLLEGNGDASFATDDIPYIPPAAARAARSAASVAGSPEAAAAADRTAHPLRSLEQIADAIVAAGIRHVQGDIIGSDRRWTWEPYPEAWGVDDLLWGYGAPVGALSIHDNQIALRIRPGATPGAPGEVTLEPGLPDWFTVDATALRTGPARSTTAVAVDRPVGSRVLRVWGTIAADAPDKLEQLAIDDPAEFAARALKQILIARGIDVHGEACAAHRLPLATAGFQAQAKQPLTLPATPIPAEPAQSTAVPQEQLLASIPSPSLADDETATNKDSLNLHAEMLLERLGERFGASPVKPGADTAQPATDTSTRAQGVRVVRSFLTTQAGIAASDIVLFDGSGLSTHDLVTPRALAHLLAFAATQPWGAAWQATLPIAGVDGSLAGRFLKSADGHTPSPILGHLHAKTGTLGEARALSGYLQCASGRTVVLSIMVDSHLPSSLEAVAPAGSPADREVMDRIVEAVYRAE